MSDFERWLEQLGLGKYRDLFAENEVDWEVLPELSEAELKDIGLPLGPRKKLLKAVRKKFDIPPANESHAQTAISPQAGSGEAERRQLTVMFADLVGSTELSQRLDPEDLREVNRAYQDTAKEAIERYGGYVARYMGDGVLAYFGFPQAHEEDAERAVRSGLKLTEAVAKLDTGTQLAVRVGIATGPVVVGDIIGEGAAQESAVVGETPNLAARLQGIAAPDAVVLSPATQRLVDGRFDLAPLGAQTLKGIAEPVPAYCALSVREDVSRFEAAHARGVTPLTGRESELSLLLQRWGQARAGDGQVVRLEGEAGIGKSRLIQALWEQVGQSSPSSIVQRYQCSTYYTATAFHPVIDLLERAANFSREDDTKTKLDKLESTVGGLLPDDETAVTLMASLLSLPVDRYAPLNMTPQKQRQETIRVMLMQLEALAAGAPVLMLFEDAHWMDPSTEELMQGVIDRVRSLRVLAVISYRPEYSPPWTGPEHITTQSLNRLDRGDVIAIVARVTQTKSLPQEVLAQILARTDGVPLFVEELTKAVLEAGFLIEGEDAYTLDGPLPHLAIPSTLHDSLVSRLDRLSPIKEVAQIGACIGREFTYELLSAVSLLEDAELQDALRQLTDSELVFRQGVPPGAKYSFKHALIQDAAYSGLLRRKRQELHARIAHALQTMAAESEEVHLELLAHHFTEAGEQSDAAEYWRKAGERALERSEIKEASAHFERGLLVASNLPDTLERAALELEILLSLGVAQQDLAGPGSAEVERVYTQAYERAERTERSTQRFSAAWGLWRVHLSRAEFEVARRYADELLDVARSSSDASLTLQAHHSHWRTAQICGDLHAAMNHVEQGLKYYDRGDYASLRFAFGGHDPEVCAHSTVVPVLWVLGFPEQAANRADRAIGRARELNHPSTLANCLGSILDYVLLARRPVSQISAYADELDELGLLHGFTVCLPRAKVARGWAMVEEGKLPEGVELLREGLRGLESMGMAKDAPLYRTRLGMAEAQLGNPQAGLEIVELAIADPRSSRAGHWVESEVIRMKGELLMLCSASKHDEAQACYRRAVEVSRERQATSLELRAAMSLVRMCRTRGADQESDALLRSIYDRFTEGLDTPDLEEAKSLLDEPS